MCSPFLAEDGKIPFIRRGDDNVSEPSSMLRKNVIPCLDHGVGGWAHSTPRNLPKARQVENPFRWENLLRAAGVRLADSLVRLLGFAIRTALPRWRNHRSPAKESHGLILASCQDSQLSLSAGSTVTSSLRQHRHGMRVRFAERYQSVFT